MQEQTFKLVYSVENIRCFNQWLYALPILVLLILVPTIILLRNRLGKYLATFLFFVVSIISLADLSSMHSKDVGIRKCRKWLKIGNYRIESGVVKNFYGMPYEGHAYEHFSLNGITFKYSDYDGRPCGFNNTSSHGGPMKEGLTIKVAHHGNDILKLWIAVGSGE